MGKLDNNMKKEEYGSFVETGEVSSKEIFGNFRNEQRIVDLKATEQMINQDKSNGDTDVNDGHVISFIERCTPIARFSLYS